MIPHFMCRRFRRRFSTGLHCLAAALVVVAACAAPARAQSGQSGMEGTITDPDNRVVPSASIVIRSRDTGVARTVAADGAGRFVVSALPVGAYSVEVTMRGFAPVKRDDVVLTVGVTQRVDVRLSPASVAEEVRVSADSPLDRSSMAAGNTISESLVNDLPVHGRNFTEFVQLTPSVLQESDRSGLVISGQRSINSNVSVDGTDFNDALQGNQRGGNELVFFFPQSAVREFQVVRAGAPAEVGRTSAGFLNVVTKSGTNVPHGDAFYNNRNKHLTSKNAFGRRLDNRQNQFGGSMGGPIRRNRIFFFGAAEQNVLRVPFVVQFQPQAAGVVVPADVLALQGEQHGSNNPTATFVRLDAVLTPHHLFNIQSTYTRMRGENFNFDSAQQDIAVTANYTRLSRSAGVKAALNSTLHDNIVNEARGQIATDDRHENPNLGSAQIVITGFGTLGSDTGRPRLFQTTRYELADTLSWTTRGHQLRAGVDVNVNAADQERESNTQGRYDYKSLADYLAGKINRYRQTIFAFDPGELIFHGTQHEAAVFLQDKIALRPTVTLNAGLRWEGQWNPQPARPNPDVPETARIPNDLRMWQPRLGLAWDVGGHGSTVVRLSSGVFDPRTPANLFQRVFTDNGITTVAVDSKTDPNVLKYLQFPNALTSVPAGLKITPPRIFGFNADFQNPRTLLSSAAIERQISSSLFVSAGYTHSRTTHLQRRLDRNLFPPTVDATGMPIFPKTRPNPNIGVLSINESTARAEYDALTLTATRGLSRRMEWLAAYTLAKNMDDDSNERNFSRETTLNPFDAAAERAPSKQDVRHTFTLSHITTLARGFTVATIVMARSGFPYTPVIGFDTQNDGNDDNDRAVIDGRVAGRDSARQPAFFDLDLKLMKRMQVPGGPRIDLSLEVLNLTRASNKTFGNDSISAYGTPDAPVATAGQPLFAPSTARFGGPRQVQLGLRLGF